MVEAAQWPARSDRLGVPLEAASRKVLRIESYKFAALVVLQGRLIALQKLLTRNLEGTVGLVRCAAIWAHDLFDVFRPNDKIGRYFARPANHSIIGHGEPLHSAGDFDDED